MIRDFFYGVRDISGGKWANPHVSSKWSVFEKEMRL